ncbi:hypothetical protein GpartN1_g1316.t1 [Galdieria partita]|uniref:RCC1-like domain-containing protein n=1 Tax=Galdieria partita TaxID=83374 RepID=A0A9C7PS64_9RHOD|nr:hypothetical protein GpartN1_g1316.t1 [Galdieria partita]
MTKAVTQWMFSYWKNGRVGNFIFYPISYCKHKSKGTRNIVYAWGNSDGGWTGHLPSEVAGKEYEDHVSGATSVYRPKIVASLQNKSIRDVACGQGFTLFVTRQGQVYSSGVGRYGQLGLGSLKEVEGITVIDSIPERVITCAAGDRHSLFVTEQGHLYTCGYGKRGELGLGTTCRRIETPQLIESLAREDERIIKVAAGHGFSVALSESGKVYSFGSANDGHLGHGEVPGGIFLWEPFHSHRHMETSPRLIRALEKEQMEYISCGSGHVFAINKEGVAFGWGCGRYHCFATREEVNWEQPQPLLHLPGPWKQIVSGGAHTLGLTRGGQVWAWGVNHFGCLGVGEQSISPGEPQMVEKLLQLAKEPIQWIAAGWFFSMAVDSEGYVYSWGRGQAGALGTGEDEDKWEPVAIQKENGEPLQVDRIYAGMNYAIAVKDE